MKITEEGLAAKRARTAQLRAEIRSLQAEDVASRRDREMAVESDALDAEIEALEVKVVDAAKAAGGTIEDAKAAMARAAEMEQSMLSASVPDEKKEESKGEPDKEPDDNKTNTKTDEKVETMDAGELAEQSAESPAPVSNKSGGSR